MKNSDIYQLVGATLALNEHPNQRDRIYDVLSSDIATLDRFIHLGSNHYVLPALYLKLVQYNLSDVLPEVYKKQLLKIYTINKNRNL